MRLMPFYVPMCLFMCRWAFSNVTCLWERRPPVSEREGHLFMREKVGEKVTCLWERRWPVYEWEGHLFMREKATCLWERRWERRWPVYEWEGHLFMREKVTCLWASIWFFARSISRGFRVSFLFFSCVLSSSVLSSRITERGSSSEPSTRCRFLKSYDKC